MRYGIISDIHANLEALNSALEYLEQAHIDKYFCLGDIVGYGANPNECLDLVRQKTNIIVAGNHDHAAVGLTSVQNFNPYAKKAIEWTHNSLTEANINFIKMLDLKIVDDDIFLVHASPSDPPEWNYIFLTFEAKREFEAFSESICFIGHSHQPLIFHNDGQRCRLIGGSQMEITLKEDDRYIVNIGSVGQPRDGDPRASFGIYDTETNVVEICRVEYDVQTAKRKIIEAGLPEILGNRLEMGQ